MKLICPICGKEYEKSTGLYNRAMKLGVPVYCGRACAGIARRNNKTKEQLKAEKAEYDRQYRIKNIELLKKKRHEHFKKDYAANPEKYREQRKRRMPKHVEYCRTPHYKAKKVEYDKMFRAKKDYGEFADCALVTEQIFQLIDNRSIRQTQQLINKSQKRKRSWLKQLNNQSLPQLP